MPTQYTTPDYNQERLTQLKNLFPDLFTTEGQLDKAELAKLTLLNDPQQITTHDRYSFAWSGKTLAKQHAFAPSLATLTHDKERSFTQNSPSQNKTPNLDAQNSLSPEGVAPQGDGVVVATQEHLPAVGGTPLGEENLLRTNNQANSPSQTNATSLDAQNSPSPEGVAPQGDGVVPAKPHIIIEGENLEVLKQLQSAYYEQIKCIYIDPPYNTGKDFVYSDNFTQGKQAYWQESGQTDEYGVKITTNTESSGRYHSDWLSMIYSRLLLARQLLTDDGVIFVSIDDNEVHNLRKVIDEVFGEENFGGQITLANNPRGRDYGGIAKMHEYLLVYKKSELSEINSLYDPNKIFPYSDKIGGFEVRELRNRNIAFNKENRPNLFYPFFVDPKSEDKDGFCQISLENKEGWIKVEPKISQGFQTVWRWGKPKSQENLNLEIMGKKMNDGGYMIVDKYRSMTQMARSMWWDKDVNTEKGTLLLKEIFNDKLFSFPKPVEMIKRIIEMGSSSNSLVLDFFAGSGTTGQAVMELNEADGGNRQCILVQMPELTDERSEAYKAGYKRISDITIERNKRVIQGYGKTPKCLNAGFEVFRLE